MKPNLNRFCRVTFPENPQYERLIGEGDSIKLLAPFRCIVITQEEVFHIIAPENFICDGNSIPRVLHIFEHPHGPSLPAAIIHDLLYSLCGEPIIVGWGVEYSFDRKASDYIFKLGMEALPIPFHRRAYMHRGVRIGGWVAWNKHLKRKKEDAITIF